MTDLHLALIFFITVYVILVVTKQARSLVVWPAILCLLALGLTDVRMMIAAIHWNVLGIFAGTLLLAELFIYSKVPVLLSDLLLARSRNVGSAFLKLCIFTSFLSIFIENIATVLIVAPVALECARRLKVSPVILLIGMAISSNLQGAGTLIGDPPSMILAAAEGLDFNDFFWLDGRPSIFFAIQAGAIPSYLVLYLFFRRLRQPVVAPEMVPVTSWVPAWLMVIMIVGLAVSPFFDPEFIWLAGTFCMALALGGMLWLRVREPGEPRRVWGRFDWDTTGFLAGIFVLVGILETAGVIDIIKNGILSITGDSAALNYSFIVWVSVAISAFIDNVPYITVMIPVAHEIGEMLDVSHYLMVFGLLIGSCLGGNITPIGAAANIVAVGLLKKEGYFAGFGTFIKVGLPFTLVATLAGYAFLWLVWG